MKPEELEKLELMEEPVVVKIKRMTETAKMPTQGSANAAGMDLYADTDHPIAIEPGKTAEIYSGIALEIPEGFFGGVYSRSGMVKRGLRLPNCVGIIDSDYRGNIGISIHNDSQKIQTIAPYERVAQIIIQPYLKVKFEEAEELSETERGSKGFGSTGRN